MWFVFFFFAWHILTHVQLVGDLWHSMYYESLFDGMDDEIRDLSRILFSVLPICRVNEPPHRGLWPWDETRKEIKSNETKSDPVLNVSHVTDWEIVIKCAKTVFADVVKTWPISCVYLEFEKLC